MAEKFKMANQTHFVICGEAKEKVDNGGSIALMDGYIDYDGIFGEKGKYVKYVNSRDSRTGQDRGKRFRFDLSLRRVMVRDNDRDFNGIKQYDWLKNYPTCEGSPYGDYVVVNGVRKQRGVEFRELNTAKDAQVALEADTYRVKAQAEVLNLDDQTLEEVSAVLGHYGAVDQIMRLKVLEFAGKRPNEYFELMKSGDRSVRAIVRKALDRGIFSKKGSLIMFESTMMGADEDGAIATLVREPDMLNALQEKLGLAKTEIKKSVGNPNFGKKKADVKE